MATTSSQDKQFIASVVSATLLEESIDWISSNCEPEDVFSAEKLRDWALRNGMVDEVD